jgi:hypothetical protein
VSEPRAHICVACPTPSSPPTKHSPPAALGTQTHPTAPPPPPPARMAEYDEPAPEAAGNGNGDGRSPPAKRTDGRSPQVYLLPRSAPSVGRCSIYFPRLGLGELALARPREGRVID